MMKPARILAIRFARARSFEMGDCVELAAMAAVVGAALAGNFAALANANVVAFGLAQDIAAKAAARRPSGPSGGRPGLKTIHARL